MRKRYLSGQICTLLLSVVFAASCIGQVSMKENKKIVLQTKIKKTQGANEYQNVYCGLQDKAGNLWFGTTGEGVYRYDGKSFTQLTVKDGLSSNTVWSVLEDIKGNIWFGTDMGVCQYDGTAINYIPFVGTGSMGIYTTSAANNSTGAKNAVWSLLQDKHGTIWCGADEALYCYDGSGFKRFFDKPGIVNDSNCTLKSIQCMLEDKDGNIWFGSGPMAFEGIFRFDGKSIQNFKPNNTRWIRNMTEQKNGNILFATRSNGLCQYDGRSFTYIRQSEGMVSGSLLNGLEDRAGNIWYGSDYGTELNDSVGGIWRYDGKSATKYSIKEGLTNNSVFLILEDRSGQIWVGTRNIGLYRFNGKTFDSFSE